MDKTGEKQYRKLSTLKNWERNPRSIKEKDFKRLVKQIEHLGEYKPLIITEDGTVLGGNMRLRAYTQLGWEKVWVSVVEADTEEDKLRYALSDNDRAGFYNEDDLANFTGEFPEFEWGDFAVDLNEPTTLDDLIERFSDVIEDEPPELPETPISKPGEIYQVGPHRVMCGDATKPEDIAQLMQGKMASMVFTDPPYNIDYQGGMNAEGQNKREGIKNDKMTDSQFLAFLQDSISNSMAYNEGAFYICMSSKELPNLKRAFEEAGGHWQSFIIWVKNNFTLSRSDYQNQYEPILYGWNKNKKNHFFIDDRTQGNVWMDLSKRAKFVDGKTEITIGGTKLIIDGKVTGRILKGKRKTDIWEYNKPTISEEHPTMKPIRLCAEAIKNSSTPGQIVLDTFGGSGSTLIAAEQTQRVCYMMELDPKYVDVIRQRYAKFIDEDDWLSVTPKAK